MQLQRIVYMQNKGSPKFQKIKYFYTFSTNSQLTCSLYKSNAWSLLCVLQRQLYKGIQFVFFLINRLIRGDLAHVISKQVKVGLYKQKYLHPLAAFKMANSPTIRQLILQLLYCTLKYDMKFSQVYYSSSRSTSKTKWLPVSLRFQNVTKKVTL